MAEINLIPSDLVPSQEGLKTTQSIKRFTTIAAVIFLLITGTGIAIIILLSNNVKTSLAKQASLTQSITSLEATEQQLFLVKDRVDKIQTIQSNGDAGDTIGMLKNIIFNLPSGVSVSSLETGTGTSTTLSIISKDSLGMAAFLNTIVTSGVYKKITLTSFSFSPGQGYSVTLESS